MDDKEQQFDKAIDALWSEREYQRRLWGDTGSSDTEGDGSRTLDEYCLYINGYCDELVRHASHYSNADQKLHTIRKIGALCVAAMEEHGAPLRESSAELRPRHGITAPEGG